MEPDTARRLARVSKRLTLARVERDELIVQAHGEGASLREIAAQTGITHVAVMKIVRASGRAGD